MMNHGAISIIQSYENIRLHKYQQENIEICLQVLHFEVDGPDVRMFLCFLVAKLLYKANVRPSVCLSIRFRGKRDFLGP